MMRKMLRDEVDEEKVKGKCMCVKLERSTSSSKACMKISRSRHER